MVKPFIRNHQYNLIKKQVGQLQHACNTVSDPKVVESVRYKAIGNYLCVNNDVCNKNIMDVTALEKFV